MRIQVSIALTGLLSSPLMAAEMDVSVELPRLSVAEYHRPYVAVWLERKDQSAAGNLAVWYDVNKRDKEGTKWLKDLRQWWRKSGRELNPPVDGLTSATRPAGKHALHFDTTTQVLKELPPGEYRLAVEAAREVGGRELVYVPFEWPPKNPQQLQAQGKDELGAVSLAIKP